MEQYISKSALVAEIERRIQEITQTISLGDKKIQKSGGNRRAELVRFLSFLDTLEVKEVDLESEYENFVVDDPILSRFIINGKYGRLIAKHFFELGMAVSNKAQKGE